MTSWKQLFLAVLSAFALMSVSAPAQADNKKPAKKEAVKKSSPAPAKKDNKKDEAKKQPPKDKADKNKKNANGKKQAPAEKSRENNKNDRRARGGKEKEKENTKGQKDKDTKGKNAGKNKEPAGRGRGQADKKAADNKRLTAKEKEKARREEAARAKKEKEAPAKKAAPPGDYGRRTPPRPETQADGTPADSGGYDENAMRDFVKQQKEKDRAAAAARQEQQPPARREEKSRLSRNEADELIGSAMGLLGVAYRFGGTSANTGFDCSGFMQHIFRKTMQVNLPRTSAEQAKMGVAVSRSELQPGDMVFFRTVKGRISHVGLYIGNNRFIHAPRTGKRIEITSLSNKYWNSRYALARRVKRHDSSRFLK